MGLCHTIGHVGAFVGASGSSSSVTCWSCLVGGMWFNAIEVEDKCKGP